MGRAGAQAYTLGWSALVRMSTSALSMAFCLSAFLPLGLRIILIATFSPVLRCVPSLTLEKWPVPSVSPISYSWGPSRATHGGTTWRAQWGEPAPAAVVRKRAGGHTSSMSLGQVIAAESRALSPSDMAPAARHGDSELPSLNGSVCALGAPDLAAREDRTTSSFSWQRAPTKVTPI